RISRAVREHSPAPALRNPDFFNASILEKIFPQNTPAPAPAPAPQRGLWSLWRLAVAGACCLIAAAAIYATFVRPASSGRGRKSLERRGAREQCEERYEARGAAGGTRAIRREALEILRLRSVRDSRFRDQGHGRAKRALARAHAELLALRPRDSRARQLPVE